MLEFDEENHIYSIDGKELVSVTTFLSKFFPKFDTDKIAKICSRKSGKPVTLILKEWEHKRDEACKRGTEIHEEIEKLINNEWRKQIPEVDAAENYLRIWFKHSDKLESERQVFSEDLGLAGTIDLVAHTERGLVLVDWKTNKEIKSENPYANALEPISQLQDTPLNKYNLQLNMYKKLIEVEGENVYKMFIVHLIGDKFKIIEIEDMSEEVNKLLSNNQKDLNISRDTI